MELLPSQRLTSLTPVSTAAQISPDGTFEFRNVSPDEYVIQMNRGGAYANKEGEFGSLLVTVTGTDVSGLVLQTIHRGLTIAGRVTFDAIDCTKAPVLLRLNFELCRYGSMSTSRLWRPSRAGTFSATGRSR